MANHKKRPYFYAAIVKIKENAFFEDKTTFYVSGVIEATPETAWHEAEEEIDSDINIRGYLIADEMTITALNPL